MWIAAFAAARAEPVGYCEAEKALYAWNCATDRQRDGESSWWHLLHDTNGCGQRLVDFAVAHRIDRVHLYVGAVQWDWDASFSQGVLPDEDALADLTTRLRAAGVEPWAMWYLNDRTDDFRNLERVTDLVASVAAFGERHPDGAFAGLHGDQEPNRADSYGPYLEMNRLGRDAAVAAGLGWGASLKPAWLDVPYEGAPLFHAVLGATTHGTLMDYSDDPVRVADRGETFLAFADGTDARAEVAVETGRTDPTPGVSFADLVETDPDGFYAVMGELDAGFRAHPSYDGLVIHDYTQYYAALSGGIEPYDAVGPVAALCPPPETPTGTGPSEPTGGDTGSAPTDSGTDTGSAPEAAEPGCGCRAGGGSGWLALLAIAARRRRRRW